MNTLQLQEKLHQLTQSRIFKIRKTYPATVFQSSEIFSLNHHFKCEQVDYITEEIQAETSFFVVNIRGYVPSRFGSNKLPLSDYETFTSYLEEDTVSLRCGNWYAEAFFTGEDVKHQLTFNLLDCANGRLPFYPSENFYFADAFNHFYEAASDFSTRYRTLKLFKSNKNYETDVLRLRTGFISRENASSRKFFKENDKYYKGKLGIGR